jgi:uncharacterized protein YkwD
VAQLRLTLIAALMACLVACANAFASAPVLASAPAGASASRHHTASVAQKQRAARAARCRRYARKHPQAHAHCATHAHRSARHPVKHAAPKHAAPRNAHAHAGSCAGADEMPSLQNLELIRSATLCLINQERSAHGERALLLNEDLQRAAQEHASNMAFGDYFEHVSPNGDTPLSRIRASGYIYNSRVGYVIGENIAWGTLSLATPRAIVKAWLDSPPHLANILDARFHDSAIGVSPHAPSQFSQGQPGAIYSQDFGVIITG